jgi:hypothetical protein
MRSAKVSGEAKQWGTGSVKSNNWKQPTSAWDLFPSRSTTSNPAPTSLQFAGSDEYYSHTAVEANRLIPKESSPGEDIEIEVGLDRMNEMHTEMDAYIHKRVEVAMKRAERYIQSGGNMRAIRPGGGGSRHRQHRARAQQEENDSAVPKANEEASLSDSATKQENITSS